MSDEDIFTEGQWGNVPRYMRGGLARWIRYGIEPGSFLTAVICNDLRSACECADDTNRHLLFAYVQFLYCHAPSSCWGSPKRFEAWADEHADARAVSDVLAQSDAADQ